MARRSPPTARNGNEITSPTTLTVLLNTPESASEEVSVEVVVVRSTATGPPRRSSYCTVSVRWWVAHPAASVPIRKRVGVKVESFRMGLPSSVRGKDSQTHATCSILTSDTILVRWIGHNQSDLGKRSI